MASKYDVLFTSASSFNFASISSITLATLDPFLWSNISLVPFSVVMLIDASSGALGLVTIRLIVSLCSSDLYGVGLSVSATSITLIFAALLSVLLIQARRMLSLVVFNVNSSGAPIVSPMVRLHTALFLFCSIYSACSLVVSFLGRLSQVCTKYLKKFFPSLLGTSVILALHLITVYGAISSNGSEIARVIFSPFSPFASYISAMYYRPSISKS